MNKTAIIYSEEEIAKMAQKDKPISHRISSKMYTAIWEHIGESSMCWKSVGGKEGYNAELASDVAVRLCFVVANELESEKLEAFKAGMSEAAEIAKYHFVGGMDGFATKDKISHVILSARDRKETI